MGKNKIMCFCHQVQSEQLPGIESEICFSDERHPSEKHILLMWWCRVLSIRLRSGDSEGHSVRFSSFPYSLKLSVTPGAPCGGICDFYISSLINFRFLLQFFFLPLRLQFSSCGRKLNTVTFWFLFHFLQAKEKKEEVISTDR